MDVWQGNYAAYSIVAVVTVNGTNIGEAVCCGFELKANQSPRDDAYFQSEAWEIAEEAAIRAKEHLAPVAADATKIEL